MIHGCASHPRERFHFFSLPRQLHSRIDDILLSKSLVNLTQNATIGSIAVSDHAPVDLIASLDNETKTMCGQFNNSLLQNDASCNDGSVPEPGIVWDACIEGVTNSTLLIPKEEGA